MDEKQAQALLAKASARAESGDVLGAMAAFEEAVVALQQAADRGVRWVEPYLAKSLERLAMLLTTKQLHEDALEVINRAVPIRERLAEQEPGGDGSLGDVLELYGDALFAAGRYAEARDAHRRALLIRLGRLKSGAEGAFEELIRTMLALGIVVFKLGEHREGIELLERTLLMQERLAGVDPDREPEQVVTLFALAGCCETMGHKKRAKDYQARARRLMKQFR